MAQCVQDLPAFEHLETKWIQYSPVVLKTVTVCEATDETQLVDEDIRLPLVTTIKGLSYTSSYNTNK